MSLVCWSTTVNQQYWWGGTPTLKPFWPRRSQYFCLFALAYMITQNPRGPSGVASKLKGALKYSQADRRGLSEYWSSRLRVSSSWINILPQKYLGKVGSISDRMTKKWSWTCEWCACLNFGDACPVVKMVIFLPQVFDYVSVLFSYLAVEDM